MNDDQWRAPGREQSGSRAPEAPGPAGPPAPAPSGAPAPGPYAPPAPGPYAPPAPGSGTTDPYATPARGQPAQNRLPHVSNPGAFPTSDRHRERVLGGAGYDSPAYTNDKVAVTSMVLGVVGVVVPGVCLLAIAFGHLALHRLRTSYEGGRGLAVAGLVLGYAMTAIWLGLLLLFLTVQRIT